MPLWLLAEGFCQSGAGGLKNSSCRCLPSYKQGLFCLHSSSLLSIIFQNPVRLPETSSACSLPCHQQVNYIIKGQKLHPLCHSYAGQDLLNLAQPLNQVQGDVTFCLTWNIFRPSSECRIK